MTERATTHASKRVTMPPWVQGTVADGFEPVREEFAAVAAQGHGDYSAQLSAYLDGTQVVDLWTGPEMTGDSLTGVFSSVKGAVYLVAAMLAQDRELDVDRRVSHYWPEFGVEGKQDLTVRDLLGHRAGVVGTETGFCTEELADDRAIAERLAAQRPFWRPGAAFGYHVLVAGALVGELVRRVTGHSVQHVFETRVRAPYGLDLYLGLPQEQEPRVLCTQPMVMAPPAQLVELEAAETGPNSVTGIAYNRHRPTAVPVEELPGLRLVRACGQASIGGVGSARGLARMYAAATSGIDARAPLLEPDTAAQVAQIHSIGHDLVTRTHEAFGLGFNAVDQLYPVLGQGSFGHGGLAGSQAFADPRNGLAYGYTRRRFPCPTGAAPENARLVRAVHAAAAATRLH